MNIERLKELFNNFVDIEDFKPFYKLLDNIKLKFPNYDPVVVLINSEAKNYHIDDNRVFNCICGKSKLKHVHEVSYNEEEYILGSECINSLKLLSNLYDIIHLLTSEEIQSLNRMNGLYNELKLLSKKKCINYNSCLKRIDLKKNCKKDIMYKTYCSKCIISEDKVKCNLCNDTISYMVGKIICKKCELKKRNKSYCSSLGCKAIIDIKYKYCFNHKYLYKLGKKECSYKDCKKLIENKYNYCYNHNTIMTPFEGSFCSVCS
tara:strand:+ start:663 stop:1448 length:786 start_codon:yes stop_codon:yes gene_type:complete